MDDIELVELLQIEDEEAFAEWHNRYWKKIYALAFTYTKSEEVAQDVVQDVFLKIWIKKDNLRQVQDFRP